MQGKRPPPGSLRERMELEGSSHGAYRGSSLLRVTWDRIILTPLYLIPCLSRALLSPVENSSGFIPGTRTPKGTSWDLGPFPALGWP